MSTDATMSETFRFRFSAALVPRGRLLSGASSDVEAAKARHASLLSYRTARNAGADNVCGLIADAGLRGRGGAWFPLARKWEVAREGTGAPVVVVNGAEDEPGSHKDRLLMRERPQLVLDGALVSAVAVGATMIVLYINESAGPALQAMRRALDAVRADLGRDGIQVRVVEAPSSYVAGEDSAAVEFLECGTAQPRAKPPFPAEMGIDQRPTVVSNVETVAHVAQVVAHGVAWFRSVGTADAPGTLLMTVPAAFVRPGVYEVSIGTPLRDLVDAAGGVTDPPIRGVQVGGPAAGWIDDLSVTLDPESVADAGSMLGCGALRVLTAAQCGVAAAGAVADFFAAESCGKCPPCRMSTQFHARALGGLLSGGGVSGAQLDKAVELSTLARDGGDCALVRFPVQPLRTARILFDDDFRRHLAGEPCQLGHEQRVLAVGE